MLLVHFCQKGNTNMGNYKKWSDAELGFVRDNISLLSDEELANKLSVMTNENITTGMVRRQRRKLGIVKARGRRKKVRDVKELQSET
jgi:hypothetical protein